MLFTSSLSKSPGKNTPRRSHRILRALQGLKEGRGPGESLEAIQPGLAERGMARPLLAFKMAFISDASTPRLQF